MGFSGPPIFIDGIVYKLQNFGGISVLFNEIMARMSPQQYLLYTTDLKYPWDRYRDVLTIGSPKIFHSTYYRLPRNRNCAVITTVHDFTYEYHVKGYRRSVHSWQKKRAVENSDVIICVSNNTKIDLINFYGDKYDSRIAVIPNGVSESFYFNPCIETLDQVLFVGSRVGYKNFKASVEAVSNISDVSLLCVGGGSFTNPELRLLEKYLPGRFRHAGFLSTTDLNIEYNKSICLLYPSFYEGFGIPILEAFRAGCPVIAMNRSSIPEVSGDVMQLMDVGDADEISFMIRDLMENPQLRDLVILKGLDRANNFSWDRTYRETFSIYEKFI